MEASLGTCILPVIEVKKQFFESTGGRVCYLASCYTVLFSEEPLRAQRFETEQLPDPAR